MPSPASKANDVHLASCSSACRSVRVLVSMLVWDDWSLSDHAESRSNAKATFIGRGWIHENEEMRCGCETEKALYERHNVSFGVEGPNGMSSDVRGLVDYYWHVGDGFWVFGKSASIRLFVSTAGFLADEKGRVLDGSCRGWVQLRRLLQLLQGLRLLHRR